MADQSLDACPLCRTVLRGGEAQCPHCGADLAPYRDAAQRAAGLTATVRELLARGAAGQAAQLLPLLSRTAAVPKETLLELHARLALAQGNPAGAVELARQLGGAAGAEVEQASAAFAAAGRQARELYNSALAMARSGRYGLAAEQLQRAAGLDPDLAELWRMKLKVDLKARLLARCYTDLAALDRLGARPLEFARLEALLPPVLPA
jgi:hypothetical protein